MVKNKSKIPNELRQYIWEWIRDAQWYIAMSGYQSEYSSGLSLEEHYMEDEDEVITGIVQEVLDFYKIPRAEG